MENFELQSQDENIDIKALFFKFSAYWQLFGISVFMTIIVAFIFNKYTNPEYKVDTTVLINNAKSNLGSSGFLNLGFSNNKQNIQNEIGKLTSFTLAYRTVHQLHFEVSYYKKDGLMTQEMYKTAPFNIVFDTAVPQAVRLMYKLKFLNKVEYVIEAEGEQIKKYNYSKQKFENGIIDKVIYKGKFHFGQQVKTRYNSFKIVLNKNFNPIKNFDYSYRFIFNDYVSLTKKYMGIKIEPINGESSILKIALKSKNLNKAVDYLNMLTQQYLVENLEVKNKISENAIKFINSQLRIISDSLRDAELSLQEFRSANKIMDISFQAQQVFQYLGGLQKQKAELLIKSKYYNNLHNYIKKNEANQNNLVAPSAMGIEDLALNVLVAQLIELFNKKAEALLYSKDKSPTIITINSQIVSTKRAIIENVSNIIKNSDEAIVDINRQIKKIDDKFSILPVTQRELLNYERKFNLADNIYTFLLEKRSEAQITKASNMPDNEIIDKARADVSNGLVFPKKSMNYLIALAFGIVFPVFYVLGKDYLNDKVVERKDVEEATNFLIIGQLLHSNKETPLVVAHYPKSSVSESFRSLRTNIQYLVQKKMPVVIMVTADMSSAGKTFVSMNLASVYAQYGKKTVLLGFDLRKPKIYQDFKLNNEVGLTSFLIGEKNIDEIIQGSGIMDYLDIIMAGPIPPNPAELIASERNAALFEELKKRYDYILIDTPPIGLVTDAFLLMPYTDVNIYLVRQNFTDKRIFAALTKDIEKQGMKMNIVINDIHMEGNYGYGYGYGYGYYGTQGNGYYTDDKPKKKYGFLHRLIKKA